MFSKMTSFSSSSELEGNFLAVEAKDDADDDDKYGKSVIRVLSSLPGPLSSSSSFGEKADKDGVAKDGDEEGKKDAEGDTWDKNKELDDSGEDCKEEEDNIVGVFDGAEDDAFGMPKETLTWIKRRRTVIKDKKNLDAEGTPSNEDADDKMYIFCW